VYHVFVLTAGVLRLIKVLWFGPGNFWTRRDYANRDTIRSIQ